MAKKAAPFVVPNVARRKLMRNELVLCLNVRQFRTADVPAIAREAGYDAMYIETEHSTLPLDTVSQICLAALNTEITPLIRIPADHNPAFIGRLLDGGAMGIVAPHVSTAEQARAIVEATKFPPIGHRSCSPMYPQTNFKPLPIPLACRLLNEETLVVTMIETPEGVANAHEIAAVPGVDVLVIGTNDLCNEMGIPEEHLHPKIQAAYKAVGAACKSNKKFLGMGGIKDDTKVMQKYLRMGARYVHSKSELSLFLKAARPYTAAVRKLI
jgi:2-keto-3-deoxy-L-rhamnonate aldolase RhmA